MSNPTTPPGKADCLFCKIRDGQIPATIVHRDERVLAFKDSTHLTPVFAATLATFLLGAVNRVLAVPR